MIGIPNGDNTQNEKQAVIIENMVLFILQS